MTNHIFLKALGISTLTLSIILLISYNIINTKPDLIIESVTYELKWSDTSTDDSIVYAEYTIRVKNIGNAPANGFLYLSWDGGSQLIKYDTDPPIRPNETFIGKAIIGGPLRPDETITFIVNDPTLNSPGTLPDIPGYPLNRKAPRLIIDESNFSNNSFTFELNSP